MGSAYEISEATAADAQSIASLFSLSWTSPFTQLQFGHVDPVVLAAAMAPRIAEQMKNPSIQFIVACHRDTRQVASVAQWALPDADQYKHESAEEKAERQCFEDEAYKNNLPESSNEHLIMEFTLGLRQLREETLQGRKHFLLENIATHPEHRGKGLAGQLLEWVFPRADEQGVLVYLDTASDNVAMRLYKRMGFEEKGSHRIDDLGKFVTKEELERLGAETQHTHAALLRYPKHRV